MTSLGQSKKSVYESADPKNLIKSTDYLRNPKPSTTEPPPPSSTSSDAQVSNQQLLLEQAIQSFQSNEAQQLLDTLASLRSKGDEAQVVALLDNLLLANGRASTETTPGQHTNKLPFWTRWRFLARFSNRARLASLRRTLDLTTPPRNAEDDADDTVEDQQRRRRRALVSLLRTLANSNEEEQATAASKSVPAIVTIEKKAKREKANKPLDDMRSRLPEGLETPKYTVVAERPSGYEIRRYEAFSVCSVAMNDNKNDPNTALQTDASISNPKSGGTTAFGSLAGYLFGKNQDSTAMKMTTPVLNSGGGESDSKTMSFVLPSEFWKDDGLAVAPKPLEGSGVTLQRMDAEERAVIMFGGYASKKEVAAKKQQLLEKLRKDKEWEVASESIVLAQYNDPFTPPWKRLNEVSVAVKPRN